MRVRNQVLSLLVTLSLFSAAALYMASAPAWAQSMNSGTVAGAVTDASGAMIGRATVTRTDNPNNVARTATTNAAGRYVFVDVTPGTYTVSVSKAGFATTKAERQEV